MKVALLTTGRHDVAALTAIAQHLDNPVWIRVAPPTCADVASVAYEVFYAAQEATQQLVDAKPDVLLVIGDRAETLAICNAATVLRIPICHVHGGEETAGAIDNVCRNAISQLASLHCVAHEQAASKLRYMGVLGDIHVTGAPALDLLLEQDLERVPGDDIVLIYHPTTLGTMTPLEEIQEVVAGIEPHIKSKVIICGANPDAGGSVINDYLKRLDDRWEFRPHMDPIAYWRALATCACLVGNSSSGIVEAPVLGVPVVNIGNRQGGRLSGHAVTHVECETYAIRRAVEHAMGGSYDSDRTYGDGKAGQRIANVLRPSPSASLSAPSGRR